MSTAPDAAPRALLLVPPEARRARRTVERIARALGTGALRVDACDRPELDGAAAPFGAWFVGQWGISSRRPIVEQGEARAFDDWARGTLRTLAARGVTVGQAARLDRFGVKSNLERRCRAHDGEPDDRVPRPRTWIVPPGDVAWLHRAAAGAGTLIVKPHNSSRGREIAIAAAAAEILPSPTTRVVQELVREPMLFEGRKVDARAYVAMWGGESLAYAILPFVLIRRAPRAYAPGRLEAELCNTSYARRLGVPPSVFALGDQPTRSGAWDSVRPAIDLTLTRLMRVVGADPPSHRYFCLWGVDLALARAPGGAIHAPLLEVNPSPQLYRGDPRLDDETDRMLRAEVSPRLAAHLAGASSTASARASIRAAT